MARDITNETFTGLHIASNPDYFFKAKAITGTDAITSNVFRQLGNVQSAVQIVIRAASNILAKTGSKTITFKVVKNSTKTHVSSTEVASFVLTGGASADKTFAAGTIIGTYLPPVGEDSWYSVSMVSSDAGNTGNVDIFTHLVER